MAPLCAGAGCASTSPSPRRGWRCARTCRGPGAPSSPSCCVALVGGHVVVGLRLRADLRRLQPQGGRGAARDARSRDRQADAAENAALRAANAMLESELAMARGAQQTMQRQVQEAAAENAQLKEELAFLQKLVADSNKQAGRVDPAAERRARAATTPGVTASWSSAAAIRRTNSTGSVALSATVAGGRRRRGRPDVDDQPARRPARQPRRR